MSVHVQSLPMAAAPDSPYHAPEVLDWVRAAQGGDTHAFELLVHRFQRDVYGKAFSILKNHSDADDVVQETFIKVFRALPGFRFESSFRTWLITITTRQALNHLERSRASEESLDASPEDGMVPPGLRADEDQMTSILDEEARRMLREAIPALPPRQREALLLKLSDDMKYDAIAAQMGTSVGSVKTHIFLAIRNLTRRIKGVTP